MGLPVGALEEGDCFDTGGSFGGSGSMEEVTALSDGSPEGVGIGAALDADSSLVCSETLLLS